MDEENAMIGSTPDRCSVLSDLLVRCGVPEHMWASTLASVWGIHANTARRRLEAQGTVSLNELRAVAVRFGTTVSEMIASVYPGERRRPGCLDGTLHAGGAQFPCSFIGKPVTRVEAGGLAAIKAEDGGWNVCVSPESGDSTDVLQVTWLQIVEPMVARAKVAVVDDEATTVLVRYLRTAGFDTMHYSDCDPVLSLIAQKSEDSPDAYVLDWSLGDGKTVLPLIEAIRKVDGAAPIILLTGTLHSKRANESDIAAVISKHDVDFLEKPTRLAVLTEKLRSKLDRQLRLPTA